MKEYTDIPIVWRGINITLSFCPSYSEVCEVYHVQLASEDRVPMPVSATGFKSHFVNGLPPDDIVGSVMEWLDTEADKPEWKKMQSDHLKKSQMSLDMPTMSPERRTLEAQICEAEKALTTAQRRYDTKKTELAKSLKTNQVSLFPTETTLFDIPADPGRIDDILTPFRIDIERCQCTLKSLQTKRNTIAETQSIL